jgi:hypothetical protein
MRNGVNGMFCEMLGFLIGESKSYDDLCSTRRIVFSLLAPLFANFRVNQNDARLPPNYIHQNYQTFKEKTMLCLASDFFFGKKILCVFPIRSWRGIRCAGQSVRSPITARWTGASGLFACWGVDRGGGGLESRQLEKCGGVTIHSDFC